MSEIFAFICTKTTADFVVPITVPDQREFNRKVYNAFKGLVGGTLEAGTIKWRATQTAVANHLLCDGSMQDPLSFPDLFAVIGTTFGGNGTTTFALPDYSGALAVAAPTVTQTVDDSGTVSTGETPVDAGGVGGSVGGNVPSGGRIRNLQNPAEVEQ